MTEAELDNLTTPELKRALMSELDNNQLSLFLECYEAATGLQIKV